MSQRTGEVTKPEETKLERSPHVTAVSKLVQPSYHRVNYVSRALIHRFKNRKFVNFTVVSKLVQPSCHRGD